MLFRRVPLKLSDNLFGKWTYSEMMEKNEKNKTERMRSYKKRCGIPGKNDDNTAELFEKVFLRTPGKILRRASLTIESAIVLPLFLFGTITMMSFMDIYKLQTEHLVRLCEEAKETGMYAYVLEGNGIEDITLPDIYSYKPIGGWISLPRVWMFNTVKVHAWTGKSYDSEGETSEPEEEETKQMVLVTETGTVYHLDPACTYLDLSITQISGSSVKGMTNRYGQHYDACEKCSWNQSPSDSVFITETGNRYHNQESCSGLKRTVHMVEMSEVGELSACSRCGHGHS